MILIKQYGKGKKNSDSQWKKIKATFFVTWQKGKSEIKSKPINYQIILNNIKVNGVFKPNLLDLPYLTEEFMDISTNTGLASHKLTPDSRPRANLLAWNRDQFLGENYPIKPALSREGIYIESFLENLIVRIIHYRNILVKYSNNFFSFDWIFTLRDLINDSISSIDIALHLTYNKAKYNPKSNWVFDEEQLGPKYGRRLNDKLKWIYQISGNNLNIEKYQNSLELIKELRNHLNHFDPPGFCLVGEECPEILNAVVDLAMIHIHIRKALNLACSVNLINWSLQKPVIFVPQSEFKKRTSFDKNSEGYNTCKWPSK